MYSATYGCFPVLATLHFLSIYLFYILYICRIYIHIAPAISAYNEDIFWFICEHTCFALISTPSEAIPSNGHGLSVRKCQYLNIFCFAG